MNNRIRMEMRFAEYEPVMRNSGRCWTRVLGTVLSLGVKWGFIGAGREICPHSMSIDLAFGHSAWSSAPSVLVKRCWTHSISMSLKTSAGFSRTSAHVRCSGLSCCIVQKIQARSPTETVVEHTKTQKWKLDGASCSLRNIWQPSERSVP